MTDDASYVVTGSDDHTVRIWDARTGIELRTMYGHTEKVLCCDICSDGSTVVTTSADGTLRVWKPFNATPLVLSIRVSSPSPCAIDSFGSVVAGVQHRDGLGGAHSRDVQQNVSHLVLWSVDSGKEIITLRASSTATVTGCALAGKGRRVAFTSLDGAVEIWGWDGTPVKRFRVPNIKRGRLNDCDISDDGQEVVAVGSRGTLWRWSNTHDRTEVLNPHDLGQTGLGGLYRSMARLYNDGQSDIELTACAISSDGSTIACPTKLLRRTATGPSALTLLGRREPLLYVKDADVGHIVTTGHTGEILDCDANADGNFAVTGARDGLARVWNIEEDKLSKVTRPISACAMSDQGNLLITGSRNGNYVGLWEVTTQGTLTELSNRKVLQTNMFLLETVLKCSISADASLSCAVVSDDYSDPSRTNIEVWDNIAAVRVTIWTDMGAVTACAISRDGAYVCTGLKSGRLIVKENADFWKNFWEVIGQVPLEIDAHQSAILDCAFSRSGSVLVTASTDGSLKIWNTDTWTQIGTLTGHKSAVNACAAGLDGRLVVSASDDNTLIVWNAVTGRPWRFLEGHRDRVLDCAVSEDGTYIVSVGQDQAIKVWNSDSGECLCTLYVDDQSLSSCDCSSRFDMIVVAGEWGVYLLKLQLPPSVNHFKPPPFEPAQKVSLTVPAREAPCTTLRSLWKIDNEVFRFAPHPVAPAMVWAQESATSTVYKLANQRRSVALKVFKPHAKFELTQSLNETLAWARNSPGMETCDRRVISRENARELVERHKSLEYAILMPWQEGLTWFEIIYTKRALSFKQCYELVKEMVWVLYGLELNSLTHCDLAADNIMIDLKAKKVHLLDVENVYAPWLTRPTPLALDRSTGYYCPDAWQDDLWGEYSDRFAGSLLIVEMLCWADPRVREIASRESFFEAGDLKTDCERYRLVCGILALYGRDFVEAFKQNWESVSLRDCVPLKVWYDLVSELPPSLITDWDSGMRSYVEQHQRLETRLTSPTLHLVEIDEHNRPHLAWSVVENAEGYVLEESRNLSSVKPTRHHLGMRVAWWPISGRQGEFYYRVKAVASDQAGPWSNVITTLVGETA